MACEIFTCEIDVILKTLVDEEEVYTQFSWLTLILFYFIWWCFACTSLHLTFLLLQLMNLLFSFLEPDRSHSTLLAGYFSKVHV